MTTSPPGPDRSTRPAEPTPADRRNPLLAALGAGDAAVAAVARAFADAFSVAAENRRTVRQRVADLPAELEVLRGRFSGDELRRALDAYRAQVERTYAAFSGRGEQAWGRLREQPQLRQAITALEAYGEKLDGRVDELVDRTGGRVTRTGRRLSGRAADAVVDATATTAGAVEDAGTSAARVLEDASTPVGDTAGDTAPEDTAGAAPARKTRTAPGRRGPAE